MVEVSSNDGIKSRIQFHIGWIVYRLWRCKKICHVSEKREFFDTKKTKTTLYKDKYGFFFVTKNKIVENGHKWTKFCHANKHDIDEFVEVYTSSGGLNKLIKFLEERDGSR